MISAKLDGELEKKDEEELEKHLAACPECRKYMKLLETTKEALHEDLPDPPEMLREGIMYKIGLESGRKRHYWAFGRWTAIAAVICIAIFGAVKFNGSGVLRQEAPSAMKDSAEFRTATETEFYGYTPDYDSAVTAETAIEEMKVPEPMPTSQSMSSTSGNAVSEEGKEPESSAAMADSYDMNSDSATGSVYQATSLPGYETGTAALDGGVYAGVCIFYDQLPDGLMTEGWQTLIPEDGEDARWLLPIREFETLESRAEWNEFYYGDPSADSGLVIVIDGEEK